MSGKKGLMIYLILWQIIDIVISLLSFRLLLHFQVPTFYYPIVLVLIQILCSLGFAFTLYTFWIHPYFLHPQQTLTDCLKSPQSLPNVSKMPIQWQLVFRRVEHLMKQIDNVKKQERQYHQQQHHFLLQLSHQLKTPLTNVIGYLEAGKEPQKAPPNWRETAHRNAQRIATQLHQSFMQAQQKIDEPLPWYTELELQCLLDDALHITQMKQQKKALTLQRYSAKPCFIYGDQPILQQLFVQMFEQAIHYATIATPLTIAITAHASTVEIQITCVIDSIYACRTIHTSSALTDILLQLQQGHLQHEMENDRYTQILNLPLSEKKAPNGASYHII